MTNASSRSRLIAATSPLALGLMLASQPAFAADKPLVVTGAETAAVAAQDTAAPAPTSANPNDTKAEGDIVVTGFRAALRSATSTKKRQDQIVEAVNAEDIGKLPDNSIAESIARLPGVAAQRIQGRANVISVRGFGPDFSVTTLNGREQTTTNDSRAVEFDQFPSEVISQVLIYKSPAANLIPQGLVGTIDLRTIRPLDAGKRVIAVGARGTYIDQKLMPDAQDKGFRVFGTYVDQLANGTLGVALSATYTSEPYQTADWQAWDYSPVSNAPGAPYKINGNKMWYEASTLKRLGLNATVQARVSDNLTMTWDGFYSKFKDYVNQRGVEWQGYNFTPGEASNGLVRTGTFTNVVPIVEAYTNDRDADLYSVGWNTKYDGHNGWNGFIDLSWSRTDRTDRNLQTTAGTGFNRTGPGSTIGFTWTDQGPEFNTSGGVNYADPNQIVLTDSQGWGWTRVQAGYDNLRKTKDDIKQARAEIERELGMGFLNTVKVGVNYTDRSKDLIADEAYLVPGGTGTCVVPAGNTVNTPCSVQISPEYIVGTADFMRGFGPLLMYDVRGIVNDGVLAREPAPWGLDKGYKVTERVLTPYLMATLAGRLGSSEITGNVGVQAVHTDQSSSGITHPAGSPAAYVTVGIKYWDILPSLNLAVRTPSDFVFRFAAAEEMMRPRLPDLNTVIGYGPDPAHGFVIYGSGGNPYLRPYKAKALDFNIEKYFGTRGYAAIQTFYKHLDRYIVSGQIPYDYSGFPIDSFNPPPPSPMGFLNTQVNAKGGEMYGVELAGTLPFEVLIPALSGFGLTGGASYTETHVKDFVGNESVIPGYSKFVGNLTAFYENHGFNLRGSVRHRSSFLGDFRAFDGNPQRQTVLAETVYDAQVGYDFPDSSMLRGLSVYLQGQNLTNERQATIQDNASTDQTAFLKWQTFGRRFVAGFTYKFAAPTPPPPLPPVAAPPPPVETQTCADGSVIPAGAACPVPPPPPPPPPAPVERGERGE
ncbi:MAG: TonB-dependent receptor [Pseudomonadota bacterium]